MAGRGKKGRGADHGGEHENAERWLLTYADMITLLVAFFIMLYAMSVMNQEKFQQLAISVRSGFGGSITKGAPTIISQGGGISGVPSIVASGRQTGGQADADDNQFLSMQQTVAAKLDSDRLDHAQQVMQAYIDRHHLQRVMYVHRDERGLVVTVMTDHMLFARGAADLLPEETGLLTRVAQVINTVPNQVRVEGHTDNLPIHTAQFPSNWELSVVRATTVLRYFESRKVASHRLEAAGYADQRPIVPNDTEQHRALNRRVEIVILKKFP
jgi:chemotaxis protein MotB